MSCKCYHAEKNFIGKIGVCWGTKEREACSCEGDEAKCDFYDYVRNRAKKTITNADRIRAMTDKELAMFLTESTSNALLVLGIGCREKSKSAFDWLDWLRQEADND